MAEKQKALKGRQHWTGRGPDGVLQTAKVLGSQTHGGQMRFGLKTQCSGLRGGQVRGLGAAVTRVHTPTPACTVPRSWEEGKKAEDTT